MLRQLGYPHMSVLTILHRILDLAQIKVSILTPPHCGKNSILLICSKNPVGTNIAIRGHPSYWRINKEINPLLLLAHISCNFLKWSHDQEVAWLYIFDPKKFKNLKIYSVTSIFLRNKLSWILKWVVPEGGSNFENLM